MKQHLLLLLTLLVLASCSDNNTTTNTTGSGSDVTGTLKGYVALYDSNGYQVSNSGGVRIELIGTSFATQSDSTGYWVFTDLPSRTYDLKFSKAGYSTNYDQFQFLGGSTLWFSNSSSPFELQQPAVFTTTLDAIIPPQKSFTDSLGILHSGATGSVFFHYSKNSPSNIGFGGIFIVSRNPALDLANPSSYEHLAVPQVEYKPNTSPDSVFNGQFSIAYGYGILLGYASGETLYFKCYPFVRTVMTYHEMTTFTSRYICYGTASNVLSMVMP